MTKSFRNISSLIFLLILSGHLLFGQNPNRPVSPDLLPYEFVEHQPADPGYYFISPFKLLQTSGITPALAPKPIILDPKGYVFWYRPQSPALIFSDFRYNESHDVYTFIEFVSATQTNYQTLDTNFNIINTVQVANGATPDQHEFFINTAGQRVLFGRRDSIFDLSAYTFNGSQGDPVTNVKCFVIQEIDTANNLIWEWNSCDHIHPSKGLDFYGYSAGGFDYCHGNSIEEDADGDYIVSFRHLNGLARIDRATGLLVWQLGGSINQFSFWNDPGFSGQHDARRLANGNILLFDNGNMASTPRTRAVEYELDTINWGVTKVWEYEPTPSLFAKGMGNVGKAGGFRCLSYGQIFRPHPSIETVDAAGNLVNQFIFLDSVQTYRTHLAWPKHLPHRPKFSCADSLGFVELTADAGHNSYLWSTGETTQSIIASPGSTYQYWVPFGIGMLGSVPIEINPAGDCPEVVGIEETFIKEAPELVEICDLLGRKVSHPVKGQLYIYRYIDGSTRKVIFLK